MACMEQNQCAHVEKPMCIAFKAHRGELLVVTLLECLGFALQYALLDLLCLPALFEIDKCVDSCRLASEHSYGYE